MIQELLDSRGTSSNSELPSFLGVSNMRIRPQTANSEPNYLFVGGWGGAAFLAAGFAAVPVTQFQEVILSKMPSPTL